VTVGRKRLQSIVVAGLVELVRGGIESCRKLQKAAESQTHVSVSEREREIKSRRDKALLSFPP
jgi:hypothetical protein